MNIEMKQNFQSYMYVVHQSCRVLDCMKLLAPNIKIGSISPAVCDALHSHIPSDPPASHRHHHLYDLHAHHSNLQ